MQGCQLEEGEHEAGIEDYFNVASINSESFAHESIKSRLLDKTLAQILKKLADSKMILDTDIEPNGSD